MPSIIYPPTLPWNWMVQRPQHLLKNLASLNYSVFYEDRGRFTEQSVQRISPNLYLCRGISPLAISHSKPRILWLTDPSHIALANYYNPDFIVYDALDEPKEEMSHWASHIKSVLSHAGLVLASSRPIYEKMSLLHPNVHLVKNGVEYSHFFSPQPKPQDIPDKKIIGYSGAIAPWLDWQLLKKTIQDNPQFVFVFIGSLVRLRQFPLKAKNIIYLGPKAYQDLPAYLQRFDVGLIPFSLTEMTKGSDPIKLYEYYAAGIPVAATPLPEVLDVPEISIAPEPSGFSIKIKELMENPPPKNTLQNYAQLNDWSERIKLVHTKIKELIK